MKTSISSVGRDTGSHAHGPTAPAIAIELVAASFAKYLCEKTGSRWIPEVKS